MSEQRNSRIRHPALLRARPYRPLLGWACRRLGLGRRLRGAHLLNLGVGCVPDAVSVLEQEPTARAIVLDTPDRLAEVGAAERSGPGGRLVCASARLERVTLPPEFFDLVLAQDVLRDLEPAGAQRLLEECYFGLKPGGHLLVAGCDQQPSGEVADLCQSVDAAGFRVAVWGDVAPEPVVVGRVEEGRCA